MQCTLYIDDMNNANWFAGCRFFFPLCTEIKRNLTKLGQRIILIHSYVQPSEIKGSSRIAVG